MTTQGKGNGDIFVNDSVIWTAPNSLTLLARRNVTINNFSISGGGDLNFYAGWDGTGSLNPSNPGPFVVTSGVGDITSSSNSVATGGNVFFEAGRDIQLVSSVVQASGSASSGNRIAQLVAGGSINLTNVLVAAAAGPGGTGNVVLYAKTGSVSLDGANIQANGGSSSTANGGAAGVMLNAGSGISLNNSSVSAIGAGGNATVTLSAGGDIALASSGIRSSGGGLQPGAAQIFLTFLTSTGNYSVNGVPGAIVDTSSGRSAEGFFVDSLPAIPDVNFFVKRPSNAPAVVVPGLSDAPEFNSVLVATMNQQVDVLADLLKAREFGVADQYAQKKLSVCN